jgi:hypothetical protein
VTYDRIINFKKKKGPTEAEIIKVLDNLIGGAGTVSYPVDVKQSKNHKCLLVVLPGNPTHPLEGIKGTEGLNLHDFPPIRGFRVWYHPQTRETIDVATSHQDEFVGAIARQAAKVFARFWEGDFHDEG